MFNNLTKLTKILTREKSMQQVLFQEYGQAVFRISVSICAVRETLFDFLELLMFLYLKYII